MLKNLKKSKGFTLIEVVIVLAIAALIILIVLQAVAAAQRTRRDTTRKNDGGRVSSLMEEYASNNGGAYPALGTLSGTSGALYSYDNALMTKVTVTEQTTAATCASPVASDTELYYVVVTAGGARSYSLYTCLEGGGLTQLK